MFHGTLVQKRLRALEQSRGRLHCNLCLVAHMLGWGLVDMPYISINFFLAHFMLAKRNASCRSQW